MPILKTLYIVDDDDVYQFIMAHTIAETKLVNEVKTFSNGKEAIEFLEKSIDSPESLPDIILLDLTMPVMDGWEFLDSFHLLKPRVGKKICIYVVSSSINPADVEKAKSISEVTDYIVKPISKGKLTTLLELFNSVIHK